MYVFKLLAIRESPEKNGPHPELVSYILFCMFHILRVSSGLCVDGASKFVFFLRCAVNDNALVHAVKGIWDVEV